MVYCKLIYEVGKAKKAKPGRKQCLSYKNIVLALVPSLLYRNLKISKQNHPWKQGKGFLHLLLSHASEIASLKALPCNLWQELHSICPSISPSMNASPCQCAPHLCHPTAPAWQ